MDRLLGGGLMFGLGLLYIMFGERIGGGVQDWISKSILGLQVCDIKFTPQSKAGADDRGIGRVDWTRYDRHTVKCQIFTGETGSSIGEPSCGVECAWFVISLFSPVMLLPPPHCCLQFFVL